MKLFNIDSKYVNEEYFFKYTYSLYIKNHGYQMNGPNKRGVEGTWKSSQYLIWERIEMSSRQILPFKKH